MGERMTREEYMALKREDMREFRASYAMEKNNHPGGWVPARLFFMTGAILRELEEDGEIQSDGCGNYRP